jgi:hypothetical protein
LNQKYEIPTKTFRCPSAPGIQHDTAESDLDSNYAAVGDSPWSINNSVSVATIEHGNQQLVLLETRGPLSYVSQTDCKGVPAMSDGKGIIGFWHNYKTTCGYADGHIELKKLGQTVSPTCEWDTTMANWPTTGCQNISYGNIPAYYK